jgi:hypothetical protein
MSIAKDLLSYMHEKQSVMSFITGYGCVMGEARDASEKTGHDEELCFAALKLLEDAGYIRSGPDHYGSLTGSADNTVFYVEELKEQDIKSAISNNEVPSNQAVLNATQHRNQSIIEISNRSGSTKEVVRAKIQNLIATSPNEYCAKGLELSSKLINVDRLPLDLVQDLVIELEEEGFIIPRSESSQDFWFHEHATEEVKAGASNYMGLWRRMKWFDINGWP